MIVLDTNVISEALKPVPASMVLRWLADQAPAAVFTTSITVAEILYRIEMLPVGKRRLRLLSVVEKMFAEEFDERILPFDEEAARVFARIAASRAETGRPISQSDAKIAAIARSHRAAVATRNTIDFERCGIRLIDPWAQLFMSSCVHLAVSRPIHRSGLPGVPSGWSAIWTRSVPRPITSR